MPKKVTYQSLSDELDKVLAELQAPDVRVDTAVELYEKGLRLITELETQLKASETIIKKLKLQAGGKEE